MRWLHATRVWLWEVGPLGSAGKQPKAEAGLGIGARKRLMPGCGGLDVRVIIFFNLETWTFGHLPPHDAKKERDGVGH